VSDTIRSMRLVGGGREPSATERLAALATSLLERHGIVTRDSVIAEGVRGGFGAVYPVLREMEERGRVRRGYFVEGLGGAQFASSGAVDRLRSHGRRGDGSDRDAVALVLAAADPANAYGAALAWPRDEARHDGRSPGRVAGAYVALHEGELVLSLERGGRSLVTYGPFDDEEVAAAAIEALAGLLRDGRLRRLQVERIDGLTVEASPLRARLEDLGFRRGYRGLVLAPGSGTPRSGPRLPVGA
jgi:ATP-dependent Lhr-like helicase